MLHDVIGGHQAYIQRKKDLFIYEPSNFAAGDKIIKSLRSELNPVLHPCGVSDTLAEISSDLKERSWVLPKPSLLCTAFFSY